MSGNVARMQNNHRWTGPFLHFSILLCGFFCLLLIFAPPRWTGARSSFARATPDGKGGAGGGGARLGVASHGRTSATQRSFRHRLWGHRSRHISAGERCFVVDDESVAEMEVVKGSGHAVGILSVLTGDARYTTALATGPGVAVFLSAEHLFKLFADPAEAAVYAARCAALAALDEGAEESSEEATAEEACHVTARDYPSTCSGGGGGGAGATASVGGAPCGAADASQLPHSALGLDAGGFIVARAPAAAAAGAGGASADTAVRWYPGVSIVAWRDWRAPLPVGAHFAPSAQNAALGPDVGGWHAHHVSELERTFCREAAISAAQMWMRWRPAAAAAREEGRGASAWRKLASVSGVSGTSGATAPAAAPPSLLDAIDAAMCSTLPLATFLCAHQLDPEAIEIARPVLEMAQLFVPAIATLPNTLRLTRPCIVLTGSAVVVSADAAEGAPSCAGGAATAAESLRPRLFIATEGPFFISFVCSYSFLLLMLIYSFVWLLIYSFVCLLRLFIASSQVAPLYLKVDFAHGARRRAKHDPCVAFSPNECARIAPARRVRATLLRIAPFCSHTADAPSPCQCAMPSHPLLRRDARPVSSLQRGRRHEHGGARHAAARCGCARCAGPRASPAAHARAAVSRSSRSRFLRARMKCAPLTAVTVDSLSSLYSVLFDLFVLTLAPRARAAGAGACRQGAEGARRSLTRVRAADELGAHARRRRVARTLAEQGAASASLEPRRHRQRHPPGAEPRDCARHERRAGSERRSGRVAEARTVVDAHIR